MAELSDSPGHIALAESLSRITGELNLDGLTELSDGSAEWISRSKADCLRLSGLTNLSDKAIESLCRFNGTLHTSVTNPSILGLTNVLREAEEVWHTRYSYSVGGVVPISVDFMDAYLEQYKFDEGGFFKSNSFFVDKEELNNTFLVPTIEVEGFGPLGFPLNDVAGKAIIQSLQEVRKSTPAIASRAPFGRGTETVMDLSVRKTWQITADKLSLPEWFTERVEKLLVTHVVQGLVRDFG